MARSMLSFVALIAPSSALMLDSSSKDGPKCIVWHSQHKSAGADVELTLAHKPVASLGLSLSNDDWHDMWSARLRCDKGQWDCQKQICVEQSDFKPYNGYRVATRGYVQVLAGSKTWGHAGGGECTWATMSRDPVTRLVSAYLYCKHGSKGDPLCGWRRLDPERATLQQFAVHWGNFLFRELLWFPELHTLAKSRPDFDPTTYCGEPVHGLSRTAPGHEDKSDPWVAFKDQLNGGDTLETDSGRKNFQAVKDTMLGRKGAKPLYDVIGLVEDLNSTIRLFNKYMPLSDRWAWDKAFASAHQINHGSGNWDDEKNKAMKQATTDPVIQRAIAADVELYKDVIVPLFRQQVSKLPAELN